MDQEPLVAFISQTSKLSTEEIAILVSCAKSKLLKKGERILNEGDICHDFYLVTHGYLRTYIDKEGNAINLNFTFEWEFATNLKSITSKKISDLNIEAGEETHIWIFNLDVIAKEANSFPQINLFIRRLALRVVLLLEENSNLLKMYSPTERYRYIENNNPKLLQRVSLTQLASYLGVTRETLSRIRRKKI